jgi:hypothetical protein
MVKAKVLAPMLIDHFGGAVSTGRTENRVPAVA